MMIEVFPQEKFTMSAGEITDNVEKIDVKGQDASGNSYQGKVESKPTITAMWLPIGEPNRVTPPDVRRDELVIIYRYADTQYYFWSTAFNNTLRKLETVTHWYSGTPDDGPNADTERTGDNGYIVEVSTHDGHILISTSKKNGEKCRYTCAFDTKNGQFNLQDDLGNDIQLDSVGGVLTATTENQIIHNTKKFTSNCETFEVNASQAVNINTPKTTMSKDMEVGGNSLQKGFANFTTGIGGGGSGDTAADLEFKGNVTQTGNWTTNGEQTINGELTVHGTGTFDGNVNAPNV
ncbi:hypothetical protein [Ralstonia phage RSL2]|uniref:Uncharacterized protein n=2 Tax=Ralstonia phage RSL2 TaxID=1585840 RepID=A0A0A8J864_9CAUD|nr:hypothetical protein [Ralstonia phage RSL2]